MEAKHSVVAAAQQEQQSHSMKAGILLLRKCLEHNLRLGYSAALCGELLHIAGIRLRRHPARWRGLLDSGPACSLLPCMQAPA